MVYELEDLTKVMEAESARGVPSPDLLAGVRRRVRRGDRLRAAAAALAVVLVAGAVFGVVQRQDGSGPGRHALGPVPTMTGYTDQIFQETAGGDDGMEPLKQVRFSKIRAKARFTVTPTGPFIGVALTCSGDFTVYRVVGGRFESAGCSGGMPGSVTSVSAVTPGVPITLEVAAVPSKGAGPGPSGMRSMADVDRYLAGGEPKRGNWSVRVYSGRCVSGRCDTPPSPGQGRLSVTGLTELGRATGTADGRARTVPLKVRGKALRLRVTCVDGAAHAVVRIAGRAKVVECEAAESAGVVWDAEAGDGTDAVVVAVLPAEVARVRGTGDAALAKAMRGVKPAGTWTLEVYAR
ncbi:hypothetical protein [Actinomadura sp. NTSP31]|uniref:hypothetical protein n=1 Tax=Actinomadura sp. NTSP31 TaxID=1735447 RepID=UPI0035BF0CA8